MAQMVALRALVAAATREILAASTPGATIASLVETYRSAVAEALADAAQEQNGSAAVAAQLEARTAIVGVFELVDLARSTQRPLKDVASACARLSTRASISSG